jgi:hypothetical protein
MPQFARSDCPTKLSLKQLCKALDSVTGSKLGTHLRALDRKVGNWKSMKCGTSGSVAGLDASKIPKYPLAWDDDLEPLVKDIIESFVQCTDPDVPHTDGELTCDHS